MPELRRTARERALHASLSSGSFVTLPNPQNTGVSIPSFSRPLNQLTVPCRKAVQGQCPWESKYSSLVCNWKLWTKCSAYERKLKTLLLQGQTCHWWSGTPSCFGHCCPLELLAVPLPSCTLSLGCSRAGYLCPKPFPTPSCTALLQTPIPAPGDSAHLRGCSFCPLPSPSLTSHALRCASLESEEE